MSGTTRRTRAMMAGMSAEMAGRRSISDSNSGDERCGTVRYPRRGNIYSIVIFDENDN